MDDKTTTEIKIQLKTLIDEFLGAVSFRLGEKPAYDKLRDLFIDGGKLIKSSSDPPEISMLDEFIAPRQSMVDAGELTFFEEVESADITELFGNVAHRFSTYEKRGTMNGIGFEARGMISTQFIRTPNGWKISSMAWDDERPDLILPNRYTEAMASLRPPERPADRAVSEPEG
jgi:hypothetical protein